MLVKLRTSNHQEEPQWLSRLNIECEASQEWYLKHLRCVKNECVVEAHRLYVGTHMYGTNVLR